MTDAKNQPEHSVWVILETENAICWVQDIIIVGSKCVNVELEVKQTKTIRREYEKLVLSQN